MNPKLRIFLKSYWPVLSWAVIVFVLSAIPGNSFPKVKTFWEWMGPDKIVHLVFYGVFSMLLLRGIYKQYPPALSRFYPELVTFIIGTVFGILIEILQAYIFSGRDGNLFDAIANATGSLLGIVIFNLAMRKKV